MILLAAGFTTLLLGSATSGVSAQSNKGKAPEPTEVLTEVMAPDAEVDRQDPPVVDTEGQEARQLRLMEQRERISGNQPAPAPAPEAVASRSRAAAETALAAETDLNRITKNFRNSVATARSSTLAEPAAATDGREVIFTGNTYRSRSTNSGSTWTDLGAFPAGPADAPFVCCDGDVVHHAGTDTTFDIMLYTNAALTNGVVRIFVRRGLTDTVDCTYTIDPGGTANNILPDYPHIATSNSFLYLTSNNITNGTTWSGSQVRRFNITQMSNCQSATTNIFTHVGTVGQRVFTPIEGATTEMFWGSLDSATSFRMFRWPETSTTVTQLTRPVAASAFANPDCRGGTGNFDFVERTTSFSIGGFRMRGAKAANNVMWLWHSSPIGSQTQAHLRGIVIDTTNNAKVAEPLVFNNSNCIAYPTLGGNSDGEFALSVAFGGNKEVGGTAAQGTVGVDDSSTAGFSFPWVIVTASGTHNRSDGRYGDYFTVRASKRCSRTWAATNYALLNGNTTSAHVNARYVEFQSTTDLVCPA